MRSATPTPSKPFSRNRRAAVDITRALFSATFSFVSRMPAVRGFELTKMMYVIIG